MALRLLLAEVPTLIGTVASCELALSPRGDTREVVYEQGNWLHWRWQKWGKASVTEQVLLSWFCKNIPDATQLGRVAFHSPKLGPVTSAVCLCMIHEKRQTLRLAEVWEAGRDFGTEKRFPSFQLWCPAPLELFFSKPSWPARIRGQGG